MSGRGREPFRFPFFVLLLASVPLTFASLWVAGGVVILLDSGPYPGVFEEGWWHWPGLCAAPGAALYVLIALGFLEPIDAFPHLDREARPPPLLSMPEPAAGGMRLTDPAPKAFKGRLPVDGMLFAVGAPILVVACVMGVTHSEGFGVVLGIGLAATGASFVLCVRRYNRRGE